MSLEHILLAALWIIWCVFHSLLIASSITHFAQQTFRGAYKYYRLLYNLFSVITFVGVFYYQRQIESEMLFVWEFPFTIVQWAGIAIGCVILFLGAKEYNHRYFFGIEQIKEEANNSAKAPEFQTAGILNVLRHPYYTGGLFLVVFYGNITVAWLIMKVVFISYLIIGTFLEERKLTAEYGGIYKTYMKNVPRFFPRIKKKRML